MADLESTDATVFEPVQSIEVESTAKEGDDGAGQAKGEGKVIAKEEAAADDNAEDDAEGEEDDAPGEEADGRPVSRGQYKALKSITDVLTNHRIQVKNE